MGEEFQNVESLVWNPLASGGDVASLLHLVSLNAVGLIPSYNIQAAHMAALRLLSDSTRPFRHRPEL